MKRAAKYKANWFFNVKTINYEPHYRQIFQIPYKTTAYKVKIFLETFLDWNGWANKNVCPMCHERTNYFKFHFIIECNYFLFRRLSFLKKLASDLIPFKNKVLNPDQLEFHNNVISFLNNLKIGQIDNQKLWRIFLISDSISNNKLCKANFSQFSLFQNVLFNSLLDWIIATKNFVVDKKPVPFHSQIQVSEIILSQDIGKGLKKVKDRTEILKRYHKIQYSQNLVYVWTDGSYKESAHFDKCACGIVIKFPQFYFTIQVLSIGTINFAELLAISIVLVFNQIIRNHAPLLIFTDSQFCFNSIFSKISKETIFSSFISQIQNQVWSNNINIVKIPSHCGILGNELADQIAKRGLNLPASIEINSYNEITELIGPSISSFLYHNHFIVKHVFRFLSSSTFCQLNLINSSILCRIGIG